MKFRKKPVVIEAVQFDGTWESVDSVVQNGGCLNLDTQTIQIATLEGVMIAVPGDWIIKGIKGELYPCKPDIFAATYEPIESE